MSFHHSRISSSSKLSFLFVFGLVCAAFAAAMPLSSVRSDEPVAIFIPSPNVDATTISERGLKTVKVKVTYTADPACKEQLHQDSVSAKLQRALDVVASELGFIASIRRWEGVPHRKNGVVDFVMVVKSKTVTASYEGQIGVGTSTVDIADEILTTLRLERQDGKSKGRVITLESGDIQVKSPIN
ncbi:uncharacterized protein C8R40DRAFT_1164378 [Lentinula edodes]|uniref:uncharacterized protein n=1 Tax=Lentinula edodes TaxID=5353 RepID=UPI001E8ECABE|nr:uncharacterized protein C8R40DRAFT_1164378 [Lentinula edodes]KAH7880948.1 hypothetical protein C8R40DRAFT_1164378 [Lentinula edodes]